MSWYCLNHYTIHTSLKSVLILYSLLQLKSIFWPHQVESPLPNINEIGFYLEQAGVGLGREEMQRIFLALKQLVDSLPLILHCRLWGKILGTQSNYIVAEVEFKDWDNENEKSDQAAEEEQNEAQESEKNEVKKTITLVVLFLNVSKYQLEENVDVPKWEKFNHPSCGELFFRWINFRSQPTNPRQ